MFIEDGRDRFLRCLGADKHDFGFLRVKLTKVDEMPVIDGICAIPQIIRLIGDIMAGEDRIKVVIRVLMKRHVEFLNDVGRK